MESFVSCMILVKTIEVLSIEKIMLLLAIQVICNSKIYSTGL